ncbi:MAG: penicillin-binding protein activator [Rhodovulum sulfidophilum]|uniref:Penicillin-binding protein activator n=1 Tax=Rhodovulum sulfidophilum TaxID=35806 RepID=A0A2W5PQK9_RHOSU|nr:MAG: penicillin-binding protein activator [Rhodovulum sulfidophilum]
MLSTRISRPATTLRGIAGAAALALLGACAPTKPIATGEPGISVDPNQTVKVALLAPLGSGDPGRERIGINIVNAAKLAQADLTNASIDLVVYPDQGTSAGGAAAARQAVAEGAKIIIGPLFSTATAGAEPVAREAGLTVLSLSNNPDVAGGNVYILGNTFANSADQIVGFAQSRGLNSFGVVYPNGIEGEAARAAAEAAIQRRGGIVVASQGYNLSVEGINSTAPAAAEALQRAGANAVILTDGPTGGLGLMAKGLRDGGLSPDYAQFLGMQRWDVSAEAIGDPALQGGAFVAPDPAYAGAFAGRYQNAYGEAPHELASLGFDGVAAVGALIAEARSSGGEPFDPGRVTQSSGFAGASGPFRLLPDGTIQRNLAVLTVQNGSASIARGAARSFDSLGN